MLCLITGCAGLKILGDIKCKMFLTNWRNGPEKCNSLSVNSRSRLVYINTTWETTNHGSSHARKHPEEANRKWLSTDLLLWKIMPLMLEAYTPYKNRCLISKWYKIILWNLSRSDVSGVGYPFKKDVDNQKRTQRRMLNKVKEIW